ncbi:hypothetical protein IJI29_02720 [Candidatus Saccharibacteria bacterium]|nr:hypothetical protein [Candidatus Saccharibacteria bacterium]
MEKAKIIPFPQRFQQPQQLQYSRWFDWEEAYWARVAQMRERRRIATERRRRRKERTRTIIFCIAMIVVVLAVLAALSSFSSSSVQTVFEYEKKEYSAVSFTVLDQVNVRSEPRLISGTDGNNSFGMVKGEILIPISKVFRTVEPLDKDNGEFYGFLVEEIFSTEEGRKFFPSIKGDPDGIVWIHNNYVRIDYGRGTS